MPPRAAVRPYAGSERDLYMPWLTSAEWIALGDKRRKAIIAEGEAEAMASAALLQYVVQDIGQRQLLSIVVRPWVVTPRPVRKPRRKCVPRGATQWTIQTNINKMHNKKTNIKIMTTTTAATQRSSKTTMRQTERQQAQTTAASKAERLQQHSN